MKNSVILKGNSYGLTVVLDKNINFNELVSDVVKKFNENQDFFAKKSKIAIKFDGRELTIDEEKLILNAISENCPITITYLIDNTTKELFKSSLNNDINDVGVNSPTSKSTEEFSNQINQLEEKIACMTKSPGEFYKGTLRSGMQLEFSGSIVVIGDVNIGARVSAVGNIIVLGRLYGEAFAGIDGNKKSFIVALDMQPMQLKIANIITYSSDPKQSKRILFGKSKKKNNETEPKIAFLDEAEDVNIATLYRSTFNDIRY